MGRSEVSVLLVSSGIEKAWGDRLVLRGIELNVAEGQVVGLVGPNGCGKSTLLNILSGEEQPDHGTVIRQVAAGVLAQQPVLPKGTIREAASAALAWHAELLAAWEAAMETGDLKVIAPLQDRLDHVGWSLDHKVDALLDRLRCPPAEMSTEKLSGGEIRRVALVRALLASPDLLLLDEPTNHLDADSVEWLQDFLGAFKGAVVLVTHDRYMLEAVATRIVEIEDGIAVGYEGSYTDYLIERSERQSALQRADDSRQALLRQEAAWAARSPAARTTKQKARLIRLDVLREQRPLKKDETFSLDLRTGTKFGRTFLEARGLTKSFAGRTVVKDLDLDLGPGERIGIVGPNGAGKSTLLAMLANQLAPDRGGITRAPRLNTAVLDQHRTGLDPNDTVWDAAGEGNNHVRVGDDDVHVASFLRRFLFPREQLEHKVAGLSGGERARLLLAKLLLKGANLLLLDEPTNDLDLMTLRVLEEALLAFDGAAVIVTHDRAFLDRVCTAVLAFEGDGKIQRYADRLQWLASVKAAQSGKGNAAVAQKPETSRISAPAPKSAPKGKMSFKEQKELEGLPAKLEGMEAEAAKLEAELANPEIWKRKGGDAAALQGRLADLRRTLETGYARWEELEARK